MNILLLSMPDSFEHMPSIVIRMPNGALTSLAGNVDEHHNVAVADLILCQRSVRKTVTRLLEEHDPQLVGLSTMTFQRRTAERIIHLIRELKPNAKIIVGGYDPSLASEAYLAMPIDFIVRGEGEITFRELTRALEKMATCTLSPACRIATKASGFITSCARPAVWTARRFVCPSGAREF